MELKRRFGFAQPREIISIVIYESFSDSNYVMRRPVNLRIALCRKSVVAYDNNITKCQLNFVSRANICLRVSHFHLETIASPKKHSIISLFPDDDNFLIYERVP